MSIEEKVEESMSKTDNKIPKYIINRKFKVPKVRGACIEYYALIGYLYKCFGLAPTELTRLLSKYKLTHNTLIMLFTPDLKLESKNYLSKKLMQFIKDINDCSQTKESFKLFFLLEDYFNNGTSQLNSIQPSKLRAPDPKEVLNLDHFEVMDRDQHEEGSLDSNSISEIENPSSSIPSSKISLIPISYSKQSDQIPSIPLQPTLAPVLQKVFGSGQIPDRDIAALVEIIRQQGLTEGNISYVTSILSPITQVGLAGFMAFYLVKQGQSSQVLDFIEGQMRELYVRQPDYFNSAFMYLSKAASIPLNKAQGPLGYFTADQMQRLSSLSKTFSPMVAAIYFAAFLTKITNEKSYYTHPKLGIPIPNLELYIFVLSLLTNIDFGSPKQVIWSDYIQNLSDLTDPAPRVSHLDSVEVTQPLDQFTPL